MAPTVDYLINEEISKICNTFYQNIYRTLVGMDEFKNKNLFFSPASIFIAVAMILAGSKNNTENQLLNGLGFTPKNRQNLLRLMREHKVYKKLHVREMYAKSVNILIATLVEKAKDSLKIANRLYGENSYIFNQNYLSVLEQQFNSDLSRLDFKNNPKHSRVEINQWVEQFTNDKIKDLLTEGSITEATKLVLVNAIYFKAGWQYAFNQDLTKENIFYSHTGDQITLFMKTDEESFSYYGTSDYQAVSMNYENCDLMFNIFLPNNQEIFQKIEADIQTCMKDFRDNAKYCDGTVTIPKFKIESSIDLKDSMKKLGIVDMWDEEKADLSFMQDPDVVYDHKLVVSSGVHKAFIDVSEKGTEAAAATGFAVAMACCIFEPQKRFTFVADKPFIFTITDDTNTVIFAGRFLGN